MTWTPPPPDWPDTEDSEAYLREAAAREARAQAALDSAVLTHGREWVIAHVGEILARAREVGDL